MPLMPKLTKKELSKAKAAGRASRKKAAAASKSKIQNNERKNPVSVELLDDGTFQFRGASRTPTKDKNNALAPYDKMVWYHGEQVALMPDKEQATKINKTIGCARVVKNDYLESRKKYYEEMGKTLTVSAYLKGRLAEFKSKEKPWLKEVDKFALEGAVNDVNDAFSRFFAGEASFPRNASKFKPKGNRYTTWFTNDNIKLFADENGIIYLQLPKVGKVRTAVSKGKTLDDVLPRGARITKVTVVRTGNKYTASLCIENVIDKTAPITEYLPKHLISMDMGIRWFCDYSCGDGTYEHVDNPRWIYKHEKKLRRLQKALSRKKYDKKKHKGSHNWAKCKTKVAKEQRKIANQRKDFHHKLSRKIADSCDVFVCENLNISGMMRNRRMAKQIASVGWYQFLMFVKYKLEKKGGIFLKVDRFFPSSKLCKCGYKHKELKQGDRFWICPKCHSFHDRDDNAVDNLRTEGMRILGEEGILMKTA
jgi:putative transposase